MFSRFFLLASLFLFISCTSFERDNPYDSGGINYIAPIVIVPSSSSVAVLSSSSRQISSSSVVPSKGNDIYNYRTVPIGDQVWMAENLDYDVSGSKCYNNNPSNCATYGRLYNWATAMDLPSSCNSSTCSSQVLAPHRGICPDGWHIPSNADWDKLVRYVDGSTGTSSPYDSPTAGRYLKAQDGWNSCGPSGSGKSYLCEDTYGFAALPGGYGYSDGNFINVGNYGYWWNASEDSAYYAYDRDMYYNDENVYWYSDNKSLLRSVRCLQD